MDQESEVKSVNLKKELGKRRRVSDDEVDEPNIQYKKLRPSYPDGNDSGKQNKTETIEIETVSVHRKTGSLCDLPSFTEEGNEAGKCIQSSTCINISESAEFENQFLYIDKEDFDNQERKQIILDERSIDQNSETRESDTKSSSDTDEIEKDDYVYRLLQFEESYSKGLSPKNVLSSITLEKHVEHGSKGNESRFISCSKTMNGLNRLIRFTNESSREREVVRINMKKLKDFEDVTIINLTDENVRMEHIQRYSKPWGYAEKFEEVVLAPKSHIPADCVERIGIVKDRTFTKDKHINI